MAATTWREEIVAMLDTGQASETWRDILRDFPHNRINERPPNVPYTFWHLLEHIRFCQWEIIDKLTNPDHRPTTWPRDHWPARDEMVDGARWDDTLRRFEDDLETLKALVLDERRDLLAPAFDGAGYSALSSILSVAEHNAYHLGEFAILRQVTGSWNPEHREHDGNLA